MAKLPGAYEYMATVGAPAINFTRGLLGYQDPFLTQTMQDRMTEIEAGRTKGNVGYDEYGIWIDHPSFQVPKIVDGKCSFKLRRLGIMKPTI